MSREVTKAEFFGQIGKLDCHPRLEGQYPYTSRFFTPQGREFGRIVNHIPEGKAIPKSSYYLGREESFGS